MAYTLNEAAQLVGGTVSGPAGELKIRHYAYDSRLPFAEEAACFFALQGAQRDGTAFIQDAYDRGVRMFCVRIKAKEHQLPGATFWKVEDPLSSLCLLAQHHRNQLRCPVVGITGSNGKTIVKEWLFTLLGGRAQGIYRSPGSFNSQLGVALSILGTPRDASVAIFEAGISQRGEMEKLSAMIAPTHGIFTNLGDAHDAGFSSKQEKRLEKWQLFKSSTQLVWRKIAKEEAHPGRCWTSDASLDGADLHVHFTDHAVAIPPHGSFPVPDNSHASRENVVHAILAAIQLGTSPEVIRDRIKSLSGYSMRLAAFAGERGNTLIDDSYSNDLEGLRAVLDFYSQQHQAPRSGVLILGKISSKATTEQLIDTIAAVKSIRTVLLVGYNQVDIQAFAKRNSFSISCFHDVAELLAASQALSFSRSTIIIKGPRKMGFERIVRRLRHQAHDVRLEINLPALGENINAFRTRLKPATKICVMVKAQAYGSGAGDIAHYFAERGVDYLAVAFIDEGIKLRQAGSQLPIIVGNSSADHASLLHEYHLEPEVTTLRQLTAFGTWAEQRDTQIHIHLKFDTGMHRLGFDATQIRGENFVALLQQLESFSSHIIVKSTFSHLSASDTQDGDSFSRKQNSFFEQAAAEVEKRLGYHPMRHLLNSAGAWRLPEFQHDMVRLGIGVYGISGSSKVSRHLSPAHRLVAQLISIRQVPANEVVGYNLGGKASHDRRIGVVNIGYADGIRRSAGDGRYAFTVLGRRCPTVGSICMDFCMIDLASCPLAAEGDEVEIFGPSQPIQALANCYETIPYEVLTGIGQRVRRLYYQ